MPFSNSAWPCNAPFDGEDIAPGRGGAPSPDAAAIARTLPSNAPKTHVLRGRVAEDAEGYALVTHDGERVRLEPTDWGIGSLEDYKRLGHLLGRQELEPGI